MRISPHFIRSEFACKCGCGFDTVDIELVKVLEALANYFSRELQANAILVHINSGCRCIKHNDEIQKQVNPEYVKGSSKSSHLAGQAADIRVQVVNSLWSKDTIPPLDVVEFLESAYHGKYGIGRYTSRTHIDVKTGKARRWG